MGKRKIPIQKIEKLSALDTTFTKRRQGLFHKAMELSVLCDAKTAIVVFSRTGKPYSCGHPSSVDDLLDRCYPNKQKQKLARDQLAGHPTSVHAMMSGIRAKAGQGRHADLLKLKENLHKILNARVSSTSQEVQQSDGHNQVSGNGDLHCDDDGGIAALLNDDECHPWMIPYSHIQVPPQPQMDITKHAYLYL